MMWKLSLVLISIALMATPAFGRDNPLSAVKGEKRVLLLFAKSRSDASLDKQIDLLRERRPELRERDLVVLRSAGNEETRAAIGYVSLPPGAAVRLRAIYKPRRSGLTSVLIGKDGTEKARWERVVQPDELFELIDSMPMRRREINEATTTVTN